MYYIHIVVLLFFIKNIIMEYFNQLSGAFMENSIHFDIFKNATTARKYRRWSIGIAY